MQYLLATYIDGPYWRSALEIMVYPVGCSFYRPFSYRKGWSGTDIVATPREGPLGKGVIGLRFRDDDGNGTGNIFIPLRLIDAIHIREQDEFHVNFRLGNYIHHTEDRQFKSFDLSAKLPDQFDRNQKLLFARIAGQFATELSSLPTTTEPPPDIWDRFIDDPNLAKKASNQIGNAVVLQLVRVRQRATGAELGAAQLETLSPGGHPRSGYRLAVGRVYDLELIHRTLTAPGGTRTLQRIAYEFISPENRIRVSRSTIPQTGNYREEQIWLQPKTVEPAPTLLDWEPRDENQAENARQPPDGAVPLRIPFLAAALPWYRFKPGRLWTGIAFMLLAAVFFALAVRSAHKPDWPVVWIALGGICAPIGANAIGHWWDEREAAE